MNEPITFGPGFLFLAALAGAGLGALGMHLVMKGEESARDQGIADWLIRADRAASNNRENAPYAESLKHWQGWHAAIGSALSSPAFSHIAPRVSASTPRLPR